MTSDRKVQVLDAVMAGSSMKQARAAAGYSTISKTVYSWLFADPAIRELALKRIADGEGGAMRPAARAALGLPETPATTLAEVKALVLALRDELHDLRDLRELILLALPEDVLLEHARDLANADTPMSGLLSWALRRLGENYNPVNWVPVRRLVRGIERELDAAA